MDSSRLNAVAARVVAWHNRHPLARRIGAEHVHSVGYVVLPFSLPAAGADAADANDNTGGQGGSLRERALARSRQGGAAALPPAPPKPPATGHVPPGAEHHFDEDFIAPLTPRQVARWARKHGVPLAQPLPPGAPQRDVRALPLPAGNAALPVLVLTAAIEVGNSRRRLLLGSDESGAVLGRRVPGAGRAGALALLLCAAVAGGALWPGHGAPAMAAALAAASAPDAAAAATPDPAPQPEPPVVTAPAAELPASAAQGGLALTAPHEAADAATVLPVHAAASAAAPTAAAVDVEPRLGRIELPPLDLPRRREARAAAVAPASSPQSAAAAVTPPPAVTAPPTPPAAPTAPPTPPAAPTGPKQPATAAVVPPIPTPPAPAAAPTPPAFAGAASYALSSRLLRTRTEADQVRDAMHSLLRSHGADAAVQVEVLAQGDDYRVVGWPFGQRGQADKAQAVLASRGMRVEVVAF